MAWLADLSIHVAALPSECLCHVPVATSSSVVVSHLHGARLPAWAQPIVLPREAFAGFNGLGRQPNPTTPKYQYRPSREKRNLSVFVGDRGPSCSAFARSGKPMGSGTL